MSPTADLDARLLGLQARVSAARTAHEDLVARERTLRAMKLYASADAMELRKDKAYDEFYKASRALATHISKKARK